MEHGRLGIGKIDIGVGKFTYVFYRRTVSEDGIQSFVAGLLVRRTRLSDEQATVVKLKELPLGLSTLIKPVPVCKAK